MLAKCSDHVYLMFLRNETSYANCRASSSLPQFVCYSSLHFAYEPCQSLFEV
jgi:hypothetical protein